MSKSCPSMTVLHCFRHLRSSEVYDNVMYYILTTDIQSLVQDYFPNQAIQFSEIENNRSCVLDQKNKYCIIPIHFDHDDEEDETLLRIENLLNSAILYSKKSIMIHKDTPNRFLEQYVAANFKPHIDITGKLSFLPSKH